MVIDLEKKLRVGNLEFRLLYQKVYLDHTIFPAFISLFFVLNKSFKRLRDSNYFLFLTLDCLNKILFNYSVNENILFFLFVVTEWSTSLGDDLWIWSIELTRSSFFSEATRSSSCQWFLLLSRTKEQSQP